MVKMFGWFLIISVLFRVLNGNLFVVEIVWFIGFGFFSFMGKCLSIVVKLFGNGWLNFIKSVCFIVFNLSVLWR